MLIAVIYGRQGMGKSSYAIQVMKQAFEGTGFDWWDWWKFEPKEIIEAIWTLKQKGWRIPCLTIDDASRAFYYMDYYNQDVRNAMNWLALARTRVGGIILTTPNLGLILKKILGFEGILVGKVVRDGRNNTKDERRVELFQNNIEPYGKRYVNRVIKDHFNVQLPDEEYERYAKKRQSYLDSLTEDMAKKSGLL